MIAMYVTHHKQIHGVRCNVCITCTHLFSETDRALLFPRMHGMRRDVRQYLFLLCLSGDLLKNVAMNR